MEGGERGGLVVVVVVLMMAAGGAEHLFFFCTEYFEVRLVCSKGNALRWRGAGLVV